ncbi:hypothetical protein [Bosea sp. (in: a-proteobacteria)]|uniref:hypothetical protein n=1 Tax=Bosea sp. (in: a-proteobacteria) TaxID=1871050 RepID=UPI002626EB70|nr:hypothetical protein [Bosea sp. (in: a-proteobacteria)]MCO5091244.1 hypothetical protein [Bosea sp. (in: a-proteobacteria)]
MIGGRSEPQFHRLASRLVLFATVFLACGMAADAYTAAERGAPGTHREGTCVAIIG